MIDEPGEIPNYHLGFCRLGFIPTTVIALKTAPRLEKERALRRERRHFKNLARIQTTENAAFKWDCYNGIWDFFTTTMLIS